MNLAEDFKKWMDSEEGKASMEKFVQEEQTKAKAFENWSNRFEKWLETNSFDDLIQRLKSEHGKEWKDKCWAKGYEVYPNNKLAFLFEYLNENLEPVEISWIESHFSSGGFIFKGYVFETICGQGCFHRIWDYKTREILFDA